jgi:tetratricopeptide (TPR) repeat protein
MALAMPARFCPQCGTKVLAEARFCSACGASLDGKASPARGGFQVTAVGAGALGFFLLAGVAMWAAILSPTPPRPGPGATAARPGAPGSTAAAETPEAQTRKAIPIPAEVKSFIADLATKAKEKPKDVESWTKLALVNARAAQLDPAYAPDAIAAFNHVLELDPKHADALRGLANLHYDREDHAQAVPFFERYLALRPDDASARTDLGTMYLYAGDAPRAIKAYEEVIRRTPSFLQAHYNLAVALHREGRQEAALAELQTARGLATEEPVRKQIDDMITRMRDGGLATARPRPDGAPAGADSPIDTGRSPFQTAVEQAFRSHPIMGPRIARFAWTGGATGQVLMREFPMEAMPPAVREKFAARLAEELRSAQATHGVEGPVRIEIADVATGTIMATVTP